ncbi:glycosyltransferase family 2 protein [Clostridium perfringens]|uniref:glycosyltransferase family 2 protein n=1 Tax=Clostridium perfringens TaxID=1502 RepID=UPI001CC59E09|nr:glycosyltransferase family 2 protein [Clostridium perfringens]MDM0608545.1 glycosyltransferase family 2 protein [Clostridium perfringens]UUW66450.1 glycosyltransferase family 2 protein [Clostridium perfringens]CAG9355475.1 glycosyl transferase family protein [Clostridium perfringens]
MKVTFIIIAYNEETNLPSLFNDLIKQDYPHELIEIILVDGCSKDSTESIMNEFACEKRNEFDRIIIRKNYKKTLPCGWNIALLEVKGDVIIRVDAHSTIPSDFITKNVECIKSGEKICGGYRPNIIDEETPWKKTLLMAEKSMFGSSVASYRRNSDKRYVNSIFHGAYSKEVFDKVGKYNENLTRTEDNEMHYRMRKAGYKICFDPNIKSYQHTRNSLKKMLRQKYLNGYWIGITLSVCPKCISIYHFVPVMFLISILFTTGLMFCGHPFLFVALWASYGVLNIIMSILAIKCEKFNISYLILPVLFLLLHLSYGIGTLIGIINIPKFRKKLIFGGNDGV